MTDRLGSGEFEIIARYFRPLSKGEPGALDLADDAAALEWAAGEGVVATTDVLIAGVHFFPDDPADLVARKLLRVNLSDLAAMGARPRAYLLSCALPADVSDEWLTAFRDGLAEDQRAYGVVLVGGDTVATPGPVTLCATALGEVPPNAALRRDRARRGEAGGPDAEVVADMSRLRRTRDLARILERPGPALAVRHGSSLAE